MDLQEAILRLPACTESVSYTHLDVYKRQGQIHAALQVAVLVVVVGLAEFLLVHIRRGHVDITRVIEMCIRDRLYFSLAAVTLRHLQQHPCCFRVQP